MYHHRVLSTIELNPGHFYLVLASRQQGHLLMNTFAARLALAGPLQVLDGGNSFDALRIARLVRRRTPDLEKVLTRLMVARAFTCFQMVAMLERQPDIACPVLVFDLLSTFCDENVTLGERKRLLEQALGRLKHLSRLAPVAVSAAPWADGTADERLPAGHPARYAAPLPELLERLEQATDQVFRFVDPQPRRQPQFWP